MKAISQCVVGLLSSSLPYVHPCLFIGWDLVLKSPMFILAFLLVSILSTSLPFSSLPSYWSSSCPQIFHVHPCLRNCWALVHKSPMFIPAFLLVRLLSTSLPCSSLPSYWSGCCLQVSHVHSNHLTI